MCLENKYICLRGGALYYVIFVVFVLSALTSLFAMYRGMRLRFVEQELAYFTCMDDMDSALALYLSDPETYQHGAPVLLELFEDSSRTIQISTEAYGLLDLVTASTTYRGKKLSKTLLAGKNPWRSDSIALYVPDKNQSLFASGATKIIGNAVLPAKGMQRASIEGKPLRDEHPVSGNISHGNDSLPQLANSVIEKLQNLQNLDSLCTLATPIAELYEASIVRPISSDIQWYGSREDYQISRFEARGGVGFCSTGTIFIRNDAKLQSVLVCASSIIVEEGFEGSVQLFTYDSLSLGKNCHLQFPSVVCLNSNQVHNLHMEIKTNSLVEGSVLVHQQQHVAKKPFLKIAEGAVVRGQVYHQGTMYLLGSIEGSLYCESFYLKTERAYYENHLVDNEIDFLKLHPLYVTIDLIQGYHDRYIEMVGQSL